MRGAFLCREPSHPRFDPADDSWADEDHAQGEYDRFDCERAEFDPLHSLALCQSIDHGEKQHADDVVEHGRAQNDFRGARGKHAHVTQDACGNADTGRHHGCAYEDRLRSGVSTPAHVGKSQTEWNGDARAGPPTKPSGLH